MRLITGAMRSITRRCTDGWANARRRKSAASTSPMRHPSETMRTPSLPSVSTAIAPIQVGAVWRPDGSTRSPTTSWVTIDPFEQQLDAGDVPVLLGHDRRPPRPRGSS